MGTKIQQKIATRRYEDAEGNTYGIDQAVRNGLWIVIRTNAGGHRKCAKMFTACTNPQRMQRELDEHAACNEWKEVK